MKGSNNMATLIPWIESTRKGNPAYKQPLHGWTREQYGVEYESIPEVSKVELVKRAYNHLINNEPVSRLKPEQEKAKEAGLTFDPFQFLHDRRMINRDAVMNGTMGVRGERAERTEDPVVREMQLIAHAGMLAQTLARGRTDFPVDYTPASRKVILNTKSGKTLGDYIDALVIANPVLDDGRTLRQQAEDKVAEDAEKRKSASSNAFAAALDDDDEEEDEDESEAA